MTPTTHQLPLFLEIDPPKPRDRAKKERAESVVAESAPIFKNQPNEFTSQAQNIQVAQHKALIKTLTHIAVTLEDIVDVVDGVTVGLEQIGLTMSIALGGIKQ